MQGAKSVLDLYCGPGAMYSGVWEGLDYLGVDSNLYDDDRITIVANNVRLLRTDIDLRRFDLVDFDAYGSAMQAVATFASRIGQLQKPLGIAITDGTGFNAAMNGTPSGMLRFLGINERPRGTFLKDHRLELIKAVLSKCAELMQATIANTKVERTTNGNMIYAGIIFLPEETSVQGIVAKST